MIAMDLHEIRPHLWYLHVIDLFSRYSAAVVITNKRSSTICEKILKIWIGVHGPPKSILTDNGREFDNSELHDLAENFNITIKTTLAYSPWSNGLLERHNRTLTEILNKVSCDPHMDLETALAWSVNAKNSLANIHGFSPYQLVYGTTPCLPTTLTDDLPALEGTTISECVARHLNALHRARREFIAVESSERIRRALRKQVRTLSNFVTGDKVYYKRQDSNEWKGPGVVIGRDGVVVFVRHGGSYVRVHRCRLNKVGEQDNRQEKGAYQNIIENQIEGRSVGIPQEGNQVEEEDENASHRVEDHFQGVEDEVGNVASETEQVQTQTYPALEDPHYTRPQVGQNLKYTGEDGTTVVKVLSRAGKATGKHANWFYIQYLKPDSSAGSTQSIDLKSVNNLEVITPESMAQERGDSPETVFILDNLIFKEAKQEELQKWKDFAVYEEVPDSGQKCISTRWICTIKETPNGSVKKARLVARGFEDKDRNKIPTDSPTCAKESLRVLITIAAQNKWQLYGH
ncbi:hypothetical protein BSL78_03967 [Apostichopus japonicus]|uniref:Integrase catalytic domain-containing protein n=1 Tax=Stichopus japonicus TaxID=307972 RepID=A0A2G8LFR0_STIJA|nr:hypothetical protein BSL78_03967 [Apostichopus japonicus]